MANAMLVVGAGVVLEDEVGADVVEVVETALVECPVPVLVPGSVVLVMGNVMLGVGVVDNTLDVVAVLGAVVVLKLVVGAHDVDESLAVELVRSCVVVVGTGSWHTVDPACECKPCSQYSHEAAPETFWNFPASHAVHLLPLVAPG